MPGMIIQFHAVPEELLPIVHWAVKDFAVHVTAFRFFPFRAVEVRPDTLDVLLSDPSVRELKFTLEAPTLSAITELEFLDRHPSALNLDIGRLSEKGLEESCLSCRNADIRTLGVWRKIANKLRKITKAGVIAMNLDTGATGRSRNHRYTAGAKALDDRGVPILSAAGAPVLHFPDPASE